MQHSPWQSSGQHAPGPSRPLLLVLFRPKGRIPSQPYRLICLEKSVIKLKYQGESEKPWKPNTKGMPKGFVGAYSCGTTRRNCRWMSWSWIRCIPGACGEHGGDSKVSCTWRDNAKAAWSRSHKRFRGRMYMGFSIQILSPHIATTTIKHPIPCFSTCSILVNISLVFAHLPFDEVWWDTLWWRDMKGPLVSKQ